MNYSDKLTWIVLYFLRHKCSMLFSVYLYLNWYISTILTQHTVHAYCGWVKNFQISQVQNENDASNSNLETTTESTEQHHDNESIEKTVNDPFSSENFKIEVKNLPKSFGYCVSNLSKNIDNL